MSFKAVAVEINFFLGPWPLGDSLRVHREATRNLGERLEDEEAEASD